MNSPKDLNALSVEMKDELVHSLDHLQNDPTVKVITLLSKI